MSQPYALNATKYLQQPEYQALVALLDKLPTSRDTLMIELAMHTGARASELLAVTTQDLNHYDRSVMIRGIKRSNDREIPLPAKFYERLKSYAQPLDGCLFPITYSRLVQIWHQYRPVKKKFHSLRHTFAIRLYERTKDLRLVKVALGHRNIVNTMIYADYHYAASELRKLMKVGR